MPPKHPTHQIYFPITVPLAPCDRSYGDDVYGWLDGGGGGGGSHDDYRRLGSGDGAHVAGRRRVPQQRHNRLHRKFGLKLLGRLRDVLSG